MIGVPWRIVDGKWTVDRPLESRGRESPGQTSKPSEPLQDAPGCNAIRSGKRAQAHSDPCRVRIEECLKTTPETAERLDRRSEVLNEALAQEVERNVRRREEVGNTAGELAAPQEPKDVR